MVDFLRTILASQYVAAIRMVKDAVATCSTDRWNAPVGTQPFGDVAYHALFFADLYLSAGEGAFTLGEFHRRGGDLRRTGFGGQLSPGETLAYADGVIRKSADAIAAETADSLRGPCGFSWLRVTRGELHVYNIRHVQHHAGALAAVIRRSDPATTNDQVMPWVDSRDWPYDPQP